MMQSRSCVVDFTHVNWTTFVGFHTNLLTQSWSFLYHTNLAGLWKLLSASNTDLVKIVVMRMSTSIVDHVRVIDRVSY